jgi:phthiodiolone/phenolphthiodiolone dimycocerosates ketoreductase
MRAERAVDACALTAAWRARTVRAAIFLRASHMRRHFFDDESDMKAKPAAFLRTTLPLDFSQLELLDSGRYHSVWLPDHMVSFWPDSIWTPEFTDLATASPSPHRHLDGLAVAAAVAVQTKNVQIATCVVDTVRRHPSLLAQTALTIDHLAKGRFILGLGSGETENTVPYGFDFSKPVSRFEESLKVIKLLWESDGLVDFEGEFYHLHHARMDTEPYEGRSPRIWIGANGPRMLDIAGRYADGWWPAGAWNPEEYAAKLKVLRESAERAGRDPMAITPALVNFCFIGDDAELAEVLQAPLVKSLVMQIPAKDLAERGFKHPLGEDWRGMQDIDPAKLPRERIVDMLAKTEPEAILSIVQHGSPEEIAKKYKAFYDAGMRVPKMLDYSGMAGLKYGARSAQKVREAEDAFMRLVGDAD